MREKMDILVENILNLKENWEIFYIENVDENVVISKKKEVAILSDKMVVKENI